MDGLLSDATSGEPPAASRGEQHAESMRTLDNFNHAFLRDVSLTPVAIAQMGVHAALSVETVRDLLGRAASDQGREDLRSAEQSLSNVNGVLAEVQFEHGIKHRQPVAGG